jgi:hypothetical protein
MEPIADFGTEPVTKRFQPGIVNMLMQSAAGKVVIGMAKPLLIGRPVAGPTPLEARDKAQAQLPHAFTLLELLVVRFRLRERPPAQV